MNDKIVMMLKKRSTKLAMIILVGCTVFFGGIFSKSQLMVHNIDARVTQIFVPVLGNEYTVEGLNSNFLGREVKIKVTDDVRFEIREIINGVQGPWVKEIVYDVSAEKKDHFYQIKDANANNAISERFVVHFGIDTVLPEVTGFLFELDSNEFERYNYSFGLTTKQRVKVTVNANDFETGTGIETIKLYKYSDGATTGEEIAVHYNDVINNKMVFYLQVGFKGTVKAVAIDKAGNTSPEVLATCENSNLASTTGHIEIESKAPADVVFNVKPLEGVAGYSHYEIYSGDVVIDFSVSDVDSGIHQIDVLVNGENCEGFPKTFTSRMNDTKTYSIDTRDYSSKNGTYKIQVKVTDNAGNFKETTKTVYRDVSAPKISAIEFDKTEYIEQNKVSKNVNDTDYSFYFKSDTVVKITATDTNYGSMTESTVASITYKVVDEEGVVQYSGTKTTTNGTITFTINQNFKGQIFAYATDVFGNTLKNTGTPAGDYLDSDGYERLGGIIIENLNKHNNSSAITIVPGATSWYQTNVHAYTYTGTGIADNNLDYKINQKVPLYKGSANFDVTLEDTYSGIRKVKWTVISGHGDDVVKTINIDNDGKVTGSNAADWQVVKVDNIVTKLTNADLVVSGDSNDLVLLIELTDRAGNVSYDYYIFGVDKTSPSIMVSYDNNAPVSGKYFNENRIATITIVENNFDSSNVVINVTNTSGVNPEISEWTSVDGITHTATLVYFADGDYKFDVSCTDLAQNANSNVDYGESVLPTEFAIDKTKPIVGVSYDNKDAKNDNYYKADRVATITIIEQNFDPKMVNIIGEATKDGKTISFPKISEWSSDGDVHTATIEYVDDGKYTFDLQVTDLAGNGFDNYVSEIFHIDKTKPTLSITGVKDNSANRGDIVPVVNFSDTNYDVNGSSLSLNGEKNGVLDPSGNYSNTEHGEEFTFHSFEKSKEADDLYTLTAKATDLAGNETVVTIDFSINRFGSSYVFSESLMAINGKYIKDEIDVVVREVNVDGLKNGSAGIKVIVNGTPIDLVEGTDFTVKEIHSGPGTTYEYTIDKSVFASEASYSVVLYSEDMAGNVNENTDEKKDAGIVFGIDKTQPIITSFDLEPNKQYAVTTKTATFSIKDNLVLSDVKVYANDKELKVKKDGEKYTISIPKSNSKQTIKVVAIDAAGNETVMDISDILVTSDSFARLYNNSLLFYGLLALIFIVTGGILVYTRQKYGDEIDAYG